MSTDLTTTEASVPVAADVVDDLQLVALNPADMRVAQQSLAEWFKQKAEIMRHDADEAVELMESAIKHGFAHASFERLCRVAERRAEYYEKCQAAVEAGYSLVPNFPIDAFVIRTTKKRPARRESRWWRDNRNQSSDMPPLGTGEHKASTPVEAHRLEFKGVDPKTKEPVHEDRWFAASFAEEVEFPVSIAKPAIMNATAQAMALKCFDEIGVLPERRGKGDPLVIGQILDPRGGRRRCSFLIAWYIDTKEL